MTKPELKQLLCLELKKAGELLMLDDSESESKFGNSEYYRKLPTLCQTLKSIRKDSVELEKRERGYEDER